MTPAERPRAGRVHVTLAEVSERLLALRPPPVDAVVGIAAGGLVPAAMLAHQLRLPLTVLWLNYREPGTHTPRHARPTLLAPPTPPLLADARRVLLVDDVGVSGATLAAAREHLSRELEVTTLVLKGRGDIVLFPDLRSCVDWPWSAPCPNDRAAP